MKSMQLDMPLVIPSNRYIVARVGRYAVIFADVLVSEILMVARNSILDLPFYGEAILGVTHHQADIIPLVMARSLLNEDQSMISESLSIIKLSKAADHILGERVKIQGSSQKLSGLGIIVDRVVGSLTYEDYQNRNIDLSSNLADGLAQDDDLQNQKDQKDQKNDQTVANIEETEYTPIEIVLSSIPAQMWQPQRWQSPI